ncbi:1-deoxy-D-xylulose 5-phosphate reductoisomerase [Novipirellula aureliae]|uniref:1-deoxy-D-xylulose 5-phosphate reductoisomerase n=1 Tax=Novipirellula aureliae TaxID=2527966 RepID=A0A5C6E9G9_9BACT|nr:1-deoxy-D-xylulose-5-phosphate reductoisomerase [Novipirellula aureliae]TWU44106.1 1-deoxy-D-xylulose 5-phosphate reductoisomerase [Novipirellula aureliae]
MLPTETAINEQRNREMATTRVAVLGATGSIGTAALGVLRHLDKVDPESRWRLFAASGHGNMKLLGESLDALEHPPEHVILSDPELAPHFSTRHPLGRSSGQSQVSLGPEALVRIASDPMVDVVVAAIVGRAGLESTLAAVEAGKRVALANKETMVVAGSLVQRMVQRSGGEVTPIDSEHSAIFQCLGEKCCKPKKLVLTASGGPFRRWTVEQMENATLKSALNHPTWDMGPKITIDSASMMNKALEVIEARWLFDLPAEAIEVVVHPQSIIHSMIEFDDGSVIAQLSPPDMRLPIQYALTYPRRLPCEVPTLDRSQRWDLTLEPVDRDRFPALDLGFEVARAGGTTGAVLNAANEAAVGLFLEDKIRFTDVVAACRTCLDNHTFDANPSLDTLLKLDTWARGEVRKMTQ